MLLRHALILQAPQCGLEGTIAYPDNWGLDLNIHGRVMRGFGIPKLDNLWWGGL